MRQAAATLRALTTCLRGEPAAITDWNLVIELANRTWLTPAMFCSLAGSGRLDDVPAEARDYLAFIHARNRERNLRLRGQLIEAAAALNGVGIEPILLKGAVDLFSASDDCIGRRMMSDIDLAVQSFEFATATSCLSGLGYEDVVGARGLGRPQDAAILELRQHSAGLPGCSGRQRQLQPILVECDQVRALAPSPTSRALHWIMHDMIKEGDYWRGRIDLRHLHDLARLTDTNEGIDWDFLRAIMSAPPGRNALETQLLTLKHLFETEIPTPPDRRPVSRLQHWRRMTIAGHPVAGLPLRLVGNLAWGWRRMLSADGLYRRGAIDFARRATRTLMGTNTGPKI